MEAVLAKANDLETSVDKFDEAIAVLTEDDPLYTAEVYEQSDTGDALSVQPAAVAERLSRVLTLALPQYADSTRALVSLPRCKNLSLLLRCHCILLSQRLLTYLAGTRTWQTISHSSLLAPCHSRSTLF